MRLCQTGIRRVRVPLANFLNPVIRANVARYHSVGIRFCFFCVGVPDDETISAIHNDRDLVTALEFISSCDDLSDIDEEFGEMTGLAGMPIRTGKSQSSKDEPGQGRRFANPIEERFKELNMFAEEVEGVRWEATLGLILACAISVRALW
ncbi:MAG: hypothetical protein ACR2PG_06065 [Hyphomicrobiaceae bacterium]